MQQGPDGHVYLDYAVPRGGRKRSISEDVWVFAEALLPAAAGGGFLAYACFGPRWLGFFHGFVIFAGWLASLLGGLLSLWVARSVTERAGLRWWVGIAGAIAAAVPVAMAAYFFLIYEDHGGYPGP